MRARLKEDHRLGGPGWNPLGSLVGLALVLGGLLANCDTKPC